MASSLRSMIRTRESLHGVSEWLLAGPQYVRSGTIRLIVTEVGIATKDGQAAIEGDELVVRLSDVTARARLEGTIAELGAAVGLQPSVPQDLYDDHSPLTVTSPVEVESRERDHLMQWFRRGDGGLRAFAPQAEPVLWPEHFDCGISLDEVNYGISLGDAGHQQPYAYVGPWRVPGGEFWNASFGAVRSATELPDAAVVAAFFADGARAAHPTT